MNSAQHSLPGFVLFLFVFLLLLCFESEASWLKKETTTITSASPTDCVIPKKRSLEGNSLLCKEGHPPHSDKRKEKTPMPCYSSSYPLLRKFTHAIAILITALSVNKMTTSQRTQEITLLTPDKSTARPTETVISQVLGRACVRILARADCTHDAQTSTAV